MLGPPVRTQTLSLILAMHKSYVLCSQWNPKDEFNAAVWVKDLKWLEASKNPHDLNNSQLPHHKISSSHIKREHSWTILVTKPQNHAKPSFLHKPDFAGFSRPFHEVFTVFSWPLHVFFTASLFSHIWRCALNSANMGYLWGWDLPRLTITTRWKPRTRMYSRSWTTSKNLCNRKPNFFFHTSCAPHSTLYTPDSLLYTPRSLLYTPHSTLHTPHSTLHSTLHTLHFTLYTLHSALHTPHSTLYTLYTLHSTLYTLHSTLYTPHSTLYTPHFTLHTPDSTLHTPHSTLYTPHSTLHTPHSTLCTFHSTLHTLHFTLYTPHSTLYTLLQSSLHTVHSTLCTPHCALHTVHSTLCTPHCALHTRHSPLYTLHFTLHTLHSTFHTPNSSLYTLHSTLYSPHPTLYTPHFTLHTPHSTLLTPHSTLHTPHSTVHTPHFTLHIPYFTLHTPHSIHFPLHTPQSTLHATLYTPHSTLHFTHSTLPTPHFTLHTPYFTLHTPHPTLHTLHFPLRTPHSTLYTLHTPHSTLYTPHSLLHTPHSTLYTFHSTLQTGNRGNVYKFVQINYCRKGFCVTAYPCVSTSVPLTYVWAFGFVGWNDMTTFFPHRHGDATGKPETRDETRGRSKTSISCETSSNFDTFDTLADRLECHKVPRLPRKTAWQRAWKASKRRGFAASPTDTELTTPHRPDDDATRHSRRTRAQPSDPQTINGNPSLRIREKYDLKNNHIEPPLILKA